MANDDTIKGKLENLKGRAKEAFGAMTGNKEKEAEGLGERIAGAAREKVGEAREKVGEAKEEIRKRPEADDEDEDI